MVKQRLTGVSVEPINEDMSIDLPIGVSTFRDIIKGDYLYIDKTQYIYRLVHKTKRSYFLSRPRRFGKSLLVSTLDELFQGNRDLFQGLWIGRSDYDWETHPVIRIDLSRHPIHDQASLEKSFQRHLQRIASRYGIDLSEDSSAVMFEDLIYELSMENQVVVLIDEYDKPLIDHLDNLNEAKQIRRTLKEFYGVVKSMEAHIRLVFITGISKFSKVSIFSELNHLTDLTMNTAFGTALGLTETEIRENLADQITAFAQKEGISEEALLEQMREWYNGFCFAPEAENVYNPFSTLLLFYHQRFSNYWFESGTPTFLIQLIKEREYDLLQFQRTKFREVAFSTYEIEDLAITPLLYQTGYLTIKNYEADRRRYTLGYPNQEVEEAFMLWLLAAYSYTRRDVSEAYLWTFIDALEERDLAEMFKALGIFFANIPYDLQMKQEKYYQTIFYLIFMMLGVRAEVEVETNDGRIDAMVEFPEQIYLFEFKLDKSAEEALQQIQDQEYYRKYQLRGKAITCVGANFNTKMRTVDDWQQEIVAC